MSFKDKRFTTFGHLHLANFLIHKTVLFDPIFLILIVQIKVCQRIVEKIIVTKVIGINVQKKVRKQEKHWKLMMPQKLLKPR